ncbi:metalloregulator ArsR/SmtB family transcription factor [Bosea thiooxidans]|nr:metalloregulator ArsR/SmtB family transcription factor [Bosea sp. (in: a-proteobacteria)]CAH1675382.1 Arsenate reductase; ArsR family transcriptional regulator [Hyphomicrobiales bacterium]CAH1700046.1 Arsenate reductase; ArsR family transcriptional regulator [Hyphomicrobiales bacterium]CAI0343807.1 ArsR family transcriptional regulator, arsenate/arsenite/antimonite-responsive transcriptional repressor / arsenate reductase (thioredoxin) [Hyphomicrobiales bacterium]
MTTRLEAANAVELLGALAQPTRLEIFRLLMRYRPHGLAAGDIGRLLAVQHNTLSTHLAALEQVGLLASRREGRHIIFAAVPDRADALLGFLSEACCTERPSVCGSEAASYLSRREAEPTEKPWRVLIVCTGNSARSIMAEAVMNREGLGRIRAYSAGSRPHEEPHPQALRLLADLGYETTDFRSKSWDEFLGADAPPIDLVVTVCDSAAEEECPSFPGAPLRVHWGLDDPARIGGPAEAQRAAFRQSYRDLTARVTALVNLPFETMTLAELAPALEAIGRMDGATPKSLAQAA